MRDKETMQCYWCKKELTTDDIVISNNGWAYCKKCKKPMCDVTIQDPDHFVKKNEKKIEHDDFFDLMMRGYF